MSKPNLRYVYFQTSGGVEEEWRDVAWNEDSSNSDRIAAIEKIFKAEKYGDDEDEDAGDLEALVGNKVDGTYRAEVDYLSFCFL